MADITKRNHCDCRFPFTLEEEIWPEDTKKEMIKIGDDCKALEFEFTFFILKGSETLEQRLKWRKEYDTMIFHNDKLTW